MICPVCRGPMRWWNEEKYACAVCGYEPRKADDAKRTNYNRIMQMNVNELAQFLFAKINESGYPEFETADEWLAWLKMEVQE